MAASSYQQRNSFLLDQTSFFPNPNTTTTTTTTTTNTSFPQIYQHHDHLASFNGPHYDQLYVAKKLQTPDSSMSMVLDDQKADIIKDTSNRLKKQKKANDYQEEKKKKNTKKGSCEEEIGYIHVRARRGQATDSHSLAERVRREKISEKMKLLQSIVPGCDKVTGKALMLDEIITYVQSLQNQVEFLSMKLASVNPMLYDFGMDLDALMLKPDENMSSMVLPIMPSVQESSPNVGAATFTLATDNYYRLPHMIDVSTTTTNSLLFQQSQMPSNILSQGNGQQMWDVDEQRLKVDNPFALSNNVTTFH